MISVILAGCARVNYFAGGSIESFTEDKITHTRYINPTLNYFASDEFDFKKIGITDQFFKASGLPKKIMKPMLGIGIDSMKVLFTLESLPGSTYVLSTVCNTTTSLTGYAQKQHQLIAPDVAGFRNKEFIFAKGKNAVIYEYAVIKDKSTAYNIFDYCIQWSPEYIVRIITCEKLSGNSKRTFEDYWALEQLARYVRYIPPVDKDNKPEKQWILAQ